MGPWFVAVFNQEWTLPPWAKYLNLRPYLYQNDFPRDNTPSSIGVGLGYTAATAEWGAGVLLMLTPHVVGGDPTSMTPYVALGLMTIIAMHIYINFHIAFL